MMIYCTQKLTHLPNIGKTCQDTLYSSNSPLSKHMKKGPFYQKLDILQLFIQNIPENFGQIKFFSIPFGIMMNFFQKPNKLSEMSGCCHRRQATDVLLYFFLNRHVSFRPYFSSVQSLFDEQATNFIFTTNTKYGSTRH